jgi:hypothetical protein
MPITPITGSILHAETQAVVGSMPNLRNPDGNRVVFSWGVRNTPAEQALRQHAAGLVDGLVGVATGMRLKLVPLETPPEIAVVYIGQLMVVPMDIPVGHTPLIDGRVTRTAAGNSEAGDYLGSIVLSQKLSSSVSFQYLDDEWYRQTMRPFVQRGRGTPFFFSGFPESHPREAGFAWLTSDPRPDFIGSEWVNISFDMGGIVT